MEIRLILSALRCHKLTVTLLALQVAFTCAIVCNAAFLIARRLHQVSVPSGLDENALSIIQFNDLTAGNNPLSRHQGDLAALRRLPGVESAAMVSNVPFSGGGAGGPICSKPNQLQAMLKAQSAYIPGCASVGLYIGGPSTVETLGVQMVAGHDFHASDYVPGKLGGSGFKVHAPGVIITQALAQRFYPGNPDHAIGRLVYVGVGWLHGEPSRIVGVVAHLRRPVSDNHGGLSVLLPIEPNNDNVMFALRSEPDDREHIMREAVAMLAKRKPGLQISASDAETYSAIRTAYFGRDTTMIHLLLAAALGLLFVTAIGIAGLASFWVQQRKRSIGIRRAIGATRGDILCYFQTENFLIVTAGAALGVLLAFGLSLLLTQHYALPHLPYRYLAGGVAALWILGQLAVLTPALRASHVPPVVATRNT